MLPEGHAMKEVAIVLCMSQRTVAFQMHRIMMALRLRGSAEVVPYVIENRIIPG